MDVTLLSQDPHPAGDRPALQDEGLATLRALEHSRALLAAFVGHTPAAVAMLDRDLRYLAVSQRWLADYGLGDQSLLGRHHYDVFPEIRNMPHWQAVHQRCLAGATEKSDDDHFVRPDGADEWLKWEVTPWINEQGEIGGIIMFTEVITARKMAQRALATTEARLRLAVESADLGLWDWDVPSGTVLLDDRFFVVHGYAPGELPNRLETWNQTLHPDDRERVYRVLDNHLRRDDALYEVDYRALRKDGSVVWINARGRVVQRDEHGAALRMIGTMQDISERVHARERLQASLQEKDVLLREVHHRVKNNLAVIASLFYLQSISTDDEQVTRVFTETQNRVRSMALVHEILYQSGDLGAIDFAAYAEVLARHVAGTFHRADLPVQLRIEMAPCSMPIDTAVPHGLILNELLTNSFKHAFRPGSPAELRVHLEVHTARRYSLSVIDNGIGVPESVDLTAVHSMGLRLVRLLAGQVGGSLEIRRLDPGTQVTLHVTPQGVEG